MARLKTCPDCAESVQRAAKVCKHCGYRFDLNGEPKSNRDIPKPLYFAAAAIIGGMAIFGSSGGQKSTTKDAPTEVVMQDPSHATEMAEQSTNQPARKRSLLHQMLVTDDADINEPRLDDFSDTELHAAFASSIESSGEFQCEKVTEHLKLGTDPDYDYITATCSDGNSYVLQIENSGDMQSKIMSCADAAIIGIDCFKTF